MVEYTELISNRENMYRFLGRLYKVEVDQALLEQLKRMDFPSGCGTGELEQGYRILEKYLREREGDHLTDLAVDFAKVFLGAGISTPDAAYPYESVYTSPERLIMQDARDQVLALYWRKGLKPETREVPEDHITFELEFMAYLCRETQAGLEARDRAAVLAGIQEQLNFLTLHLLNWIPAFCADLEKYARTEFYKGVAKVTGNFLQLEHRLLTDLIAEIGNE